MELKNDPISSKKSKTAKMSKLLKPQTPQTRGNPGKIAQQYQNKGKYQGWPIPNNPKMTTLKGHKISRNTELRLTTLTSDLVPPCPPIEYKGSGTPLQQKDPAIERSLRNRKINSATGRIEPQAFQNWLKRLKRFRELT